MKQQEHSMTLQLAADNRGCTETFVLDGCADQMVVEMNGVEAQTGGRMVELQIRIKSICPGRRTALGVTLHELDAENNEQPRGMQTMTVPAHHEEGACDILIRGVRFVLPGDLCPEGRQRARYFVVRTTAHYIDMETASSCSLRT